PPSIYTLSLHDALPILAALTHREREVVAAVGRGLTNAEIAAELHVSVATVKAQVSHVLAALDVGNRTQVALLAHDAGLVQPSSHDRGLSTPQPAALLGVCMGCTPTLPVAPP